MCPDVSNSVSPLYVVVEVLSFRCLKNSDKIYFLKAFGFYITTVGKIVSVVLDIINFSDVPLL